MTDHEHDVLAHKTDQSLDRLLFFSDGVFAIAITLLALELHAPPDWDGTLAMLLNHEARTLLAFALSFAVVGVFWNSHRRIFLGMARFSGGVFALNLLLLGLIALMPFTTTLMTGSRDGLLIYGGLVGIAGLVQGLTYAYAVFVAKVMNAHRPWPTRLSAFLMMSFMPPLCCWPSLLFFNHAPTVYVAADAAALAALISFQAYTSRRYGPRSVGYAQA
jgi:uncharacterized membrane protein